MKRPFSSIGPRVAQPQTSPLLGEAQVQNSAGGYVYALDDFAAFLRFLILGSEGGSYYASPQKLTRENAARTIRCIEADGARVVRTIVEVSDEGRAPKNDPAIFALALAASAADPATRKLALAALPKVCRIPTHLFHFMAFVTTFRGLGRGLRSSLANWYLDLPTEKLAQHVVKYQSRDGWSNADVLRLAHPKTSDEARNAIFKWCVDGIEGHKADGPTLPQVIVGFEAAKSAESARDLCRLIQNHGLTREMVPTEFLKDPDVWAALLEKMPATAMIRNLGNLSKCGLLAPLSDASRKVVAVLGDKEWLNKARVHPIEILIALKTYASGHGVRGDGAWKPVPAVVDALDDAFYLAFKSLKPTGKRIVFGIDVSGSMRTAAIANMPLSACEGAAAMAMATAKVEKDYYTFGFCDRFVDLGITPKMRLDEVCRAAQRNNFGRTDCAQPVLWAMENRVEVDGFVIITDNETYAGAIHPSQALRQYRQKMGVPAACEVVMGMTSTNFTIADPDDRRTLDVAGFDSAAPQIVSDFIAERV
jgi:60 kDa SS-A/Ro ribonucleoprotein